MRKVNRPIKFFGLTSGQFGLFMIATAIVIIVCVFKQMHSIIIATVITSILLISGLLFKNLQKEHKAGNPDYLGSLSIKSATPKKIVDKKRIFSFILNLKKCQE